MGAHPTPDQAEPAALIERLRRQVEELTRERDEARHIVREIHWMAVRYADGRRSYAPGMCNDAIRKGYEAGWLNYRGFKQRDLDPQYAREGDKPEWQSVDARNASLEARLAKAVEALEWYGEQALLCRYVPRGGAPGRHALAADGGARARTILAELKGGQNV